MYLCAATYRNVTVRLLDVNEAPIVTNGQNWNITENATIGSVVATVRYTDPDAFPLNIARFSILADSSGGMVVLDNATLGTLRLASTAKLNYEGSQRKFSVVVQAVDASDPTLFSTGTANINVMDAPDLPTIANGQLLRITDGAANIGASFPTPVVATLEDNPSGTYASTLTYALVNYPAAAAACPNNDTELATTTGDVSGAPLFFINPLSGTLTIAAQPAVGTPFGGPWAARGTTFALQGYLAKAAYTVCVNVSSRYRWAVGPATAAVVANLGAVPMISSYWIGNGSVATNMLDTLIPTPIYFAGSNLGANGTAVYANYSSLATGMSFSSPGCTILNSTLLTCLSAPGVGAEYEWRITINGNPVPATVTLLTSYHPPQLSAISNHTLMPHEGGRWIVLRGRYFGSIVSPTGSYAQLDYGPSLIDLRYTCQLSWGAGWSDAQKDGQALCVADRGAGHNLVWRLTVGGQAITNAGGDATQLLSYIPPVITSVQIPGSVNGTTGVTNLTAIKNLDTRGGTRLILRGAGFGGDPSNLITVRYSTFGTGAQVFTMTTCDRAVQTDPTVIVCVTAPGVGANLKLVAEVEGQTSLATSGNVTLAQGISYAPPRITSISGGAIRAMNTAGGDVFYISGNFFGPDLPTSPDWVRYGPLVTGTGVNGSSSGTSVSKYSAVACTVFTPHITLECVSAPGTGTKHWVQASVGGQSTAPYNATLAYAAPVISSFAGAGAANALTTGNQIVRITGECRSRVV